MANNSIERLRRFCIAYEYARALKIFADGTNEIDHVKARVKELREDKLSLEASIAAKDDEAKQLEEERAKQSENGELKALAGKVDTLSKNLVKSQSGVSNKQEALDAERKSCESLGASVAELEAASSGADGDSDRIAEELARCKEAKADAERLIAEAENEIAGCADGGDGRDGSGRSFKERLIEAQEKRRAYESEKKELGTKVSLLKKELAAKQKEQRTDKERQRDKACSAPHKGAEPRVWRCVGERRELQPARYVRRGTLTGDALYLNRRASAKQLATTKCKEGQ